jgi:hypothetical protein
MPDPRQAAAELHIALSNLRCSALSAAHAFLETERAALADARDDVRAHITGSGPVRIDRNGAPEPVARELATFCDLAERLVGATPRESLRDEGPRLAVQRLANDVAIARAVLAAIGSAAPRRSSLPPSPTQQTG